MGHRCNCKKLEHFTVHNKSFLRKSAAVGETGLGNCNAICNRKCNRKCERKLKKIYSMLLESVLQCRIKSCLTSTVTGNFC